MKGNDQRNAVVVIYDPVDDFVFTNIIANVLNERGVAIKEKPKLLNDNQINIEFVKGNNAVKGAKHMELRM